MIILSILFFVTAILYSSVGFGGGSTYLALLILSTKIFPDLSVFKVLVSVTVNNAIFTFIKFK